MMQIPAVLENGIRDAIGRAYGEAAIGWIFDKVFEQIQAAQLEILNQPEITDVIANPDWYRDGIMYQTYPDQLGNSNPETPTTFYELIQMLPYLSELGVTILYISPFMKSPMGDVGFDISDYCDIRPELGGLSAFDAFVEKAREAGIKIKMDLVLNHVSDQHAWFQAARNGDLEKLNYFVHTTTLPAWERGPDDQRGIVIRYTDPDGGVTPRTMVFPDKSDHHYREVLIQDKPYYFYHTFYPFQMDLNWENTQVLFEILKVVVFWIKRGISIFRLDAIPYLIQTPGTWGENDPRTHALVQLISQFIQAVHPGVVLLAESSQPSELLMPYFGQAQELEYPEGKFIRTNEVQLAYNFLATQGILGSILTQKKDLFWSNVRDVPELPQGAAWNLFLRCHDDFQMEHLEPEIRKTIFDQLIEKGATVKPGIALGGRLMNFLDSNIDQIELAYAILLSLPFLPCLYYGDEIGVENNWDYARAMEQFRRANLTADLYFDGRDINRGPVLKEQFLHALENPESPAGDLFSRIRTLIATRKKYSAFSRGEWLQIPDTDPAVIAYVVQDAAHTLLIMHNVSSQHVSYDLPLPGTLVQDTGAAVFDIRRNATMGMTKSDDQHLRCHLQPYESLWVKLN